MGAPVGTAVVCFPCCGLVVNRGLGLALPENAESTQRGLLREVQEGRRGGSAGQAGGDRPPRS